jgi:hypothetical protein
MDIFLLSLDILHLRNLSPGHQEREVLCTAHHIHHFSLLDTVHIKKLFFGMGGESVPGKKTKCPRRVGPSMHQPFIFLCCLLACFVALPHPQHQTTSSLRNTFAASLATSLFVSLFYCG